MTHAYQIEGMTCTNCVNKVKNQLLLMPEILSAEVTLDPPRAVITMQEHIRLSALQEAVAKAGSYTIKPDAGDSSHASMESGASWLSTYKPLLLLFIFITGIAAIVAWGEGVFNVITWMNVFMAGFFLSFSFFKLLDLKGFAEAYSSYDVVAMRFFTYGYVYPFFELALGVAYLTGFNPLITNIATIAIMGTSSIGVIQSVLRKRQIRCACLGAVFNLPMSTVTIIEDVLMVVMAGIMLVMMG